MSGNPRTLSGVVVSNKADKTITVLVERKVKHSKYGKIIKRRSKLHAHDEENAANLGDKVTIRESKPYSKTKTWLLVSNTNNNSANNDEVAE
ncbi:30S ribosomal protein S17 [SAR86 cluster bacterium]|jgi:small subunit ribosomal protein S17|nr:30S ribosomal protein S17 [SAR86 cluster bacterium]